jgi:glycosyltransferase involved in cell wall biosynthesis
MPQPWPVLLLVRELGIGGCERDLTRIALGLDRARFQPHVGCFRPEGFRGEELRRAGVPILALPVRSFRSPALLAGLAQMGAYVARHDIRLVHSYDVPTTIFGVPAARLFRVPVVISSQLGHRALPRPASRLALRLTDQLVDGIVVNCQAMRRHLVEDEKVSPHRIHLCYNGVDTAVFHPFGRARPAILASAPLVIGVVCALRPEKRVDLLLEAFAQVRPLQPGMKLVVVGSGGELPALQALACKLGLAADGIFQPATPEVAAWLRAIDIFVLPSSSEAFSNALLEAMACGCCPVGSRVGGTPELIDDGERGLLFTPGSAAELAEKLRLLIAQPPLRARFAAAAAAFARERLHAGLAVSTMADLYEAWLQRSALPA